VFLNHLTTGLLFQAPRLIQSPVSILNDVKMVNDYLGLRQNLFIGQINLL